MRAEGRVIKLGVPRVLGVLILLAFAVLVALLGTCLASSSTTAYATRMLLATAGTTALQLRQPNSTVRLGVITINILGTNERREQEENSTDIGIKGKGNYWAELLLVSRMHNPKLRLIAMVDRPDAVAAHPVVASALAEARIELHSMDQYCGNGSRAATLITAAPDYYQSYWEFKAAQDPEAKLPRCFNRTRTQACSRYVAFRMVMLARFCMQADLSNALGLTHVVTMDADIMLLDGLEEKQMPYLRAAEIVTPTEWSSQVVMWRASALNDFCDAMIEHVRMPREKQHEVFRIGSLFIKHSEWTDMTFLAAYLRTLRPERSRIVLCGTPAAMDETQCTRLKWAYAIGARIVEGNRECRELNQTLEWRQPGGPGTPVQAWTRYTYWPAVGHDKLAGEGPPERMPLIHFLSPDCKPVAREVYMREFVGRQLLPDLTTADAVASNVGH